jgi:urease accessory protein
MSLGFALRVAGLALVVACSGAAPVHAHHAMGGRTPETFVQGLLSGLGHPVIGIDHLAFIVAMGIAVGVAGLHLALPALFIAASALGVVLHVFGVALPLVEIAVAASVLLSGAMLASDRAPGVRGWAALIAVAGLFHGQAFGAAVVGAEPAPFAAYLTGLVIVQAALATAIALLARRSAADAIKPRLAGATIAGIGIAILAGQLLPA